MSQPKKRDIADFFRPFAKTIPRKRPSPDLDDDTTFARSEISTTITPSTSRRAEHCIFEQHRATPRHAIASPLTPGTGRSVSIPYRSPAGASALKPTSAGKSLFELPANRSQDTPKPASSFSFADAPVTSRKVLEDGKLVEVRDSDDSDNESLQSLTDIFARKPGESDTAGSSQTDVSSRQEEERRSLLSLYTGGRSNPILKKDRLRDLQRLEQANKLDLTAIFEEDRKDEERRAALARANAELEELAREAEEGRQAEMDKKMLAAILQGDSSEVKPEEMSRLMRAVDRTEAFAADKTFSFFRREGPRDSSRLKGTKKEFPASAIPASLWQPNDSAARDRAYLGGFVTELGDYNKLDDEVLRWTFDSVLTEPRDDVRQSYIDTTAAVSPRWTRSNVTPDDIQSLFDILGADPHALRDGIPVEARYHLKTEPPRQDYKELCYTLRLMDCICPDMDFATLSKLTSITSRLTLDQHLMTSNLVCHAVESLLNKITDLPDLESRAHVHERLLSDLTSNLMEPNLQSQFLTHFTPISPAAAKLQSQLAFTFLFGEDFAQKLLKSPSTSNLTISPLLRLTNQLTKHPLFTTTRSLSALSNATSYSKLTSLTTILDIGIGLGFLPASFSSRSKEQAFNADVDTLADHIHALSVSIADTGASHMSRTECKDTLAALCYRLLYQVRTKGRRKRHVFDGEGKPGNIGSGKVVGKGAIRDAFEVETTRRSGDFMSKFLKKKEGKEEKKKDGDGDEFAEGSEKENDALVKFA